MSLNDFFAANAGSVYLRPVGIPDCFTLPAGLPHGCKPPPPPPPLSMQHPCGAGPPKPRTMAAVSPLHQVVPPQPNLSPYEAAGGLNAFGPSQRTSSFAAALRKLAKQAGDPIVGEKDIAQISPVSSPALAQRSLTPKRNGHSTGPPSSMYLTGGTHPVNSTSFPSSSPPVVTIAPSRQHSTHTTDTRKLQVMDLGGLTSSNVTPSTVSNGHLPDPLSLKLDSGKSGGRSTTSEKWEDHASKSLPNSSASSQSRPHATIAPLPRPDDSLASSRGFQPYRSADDIRTAMPHHLSPFEHHPPAAYPYTPAFLPPPHLPHPAYRIDDALFLDRYGLLRSPVMPFPGQPGMMGSPAAFYPQSRYDLLAQSLSLSSANSSLLHHERVKLEEERRQREKEVELDQSRKREQERREKEQKEKEHKEREKEHKEREKEHKEKERRDKAHRDKSDHGEHKSSNHSTNSHSKRAEYSAPRSDPVMTSAAANSSPPMSSSAPLNLVVHPNSGNPVSCDHHKTQAELWMPWQQNSSSSQHSTKDNSSHDESSASLSSPYKMPISLPQENHRPQPSKDVVPAPPLDKYHAPYNLHFYPEKRHANPEAGTDTDAKKHPTHHVASNSRKFDSIHHHIAELSKKDSSEWKHEKLQKSCSNNHRKSISEVKKLRDDTHHQTTPAAATSNTHNVHHRKHLNGMIKPVLSQDEGMHARLLETEKCRLEFNNLKLQSSSEKLQVPNLIHNAVPVSPKDPQMMYIDYNHHMMSFVKPTVDTVPLVSKLDKEAEDLKKRGRLDVDVEEPSMKDFLTLTKSPPISLDSNSMKTRYLKLLGLTSRLKRKKIEFDIYLKRRKILMEDRGTRSDTEANDNTKDTPGPTLLDTYTNIESVSEKLRTQSNTERTQFMVTLGLRQLTSVQKEENTRVRKMTENERSRRNLRLKIKARKKTTSLSPPSPEVKKETDIKTEGISIKASSQNVQGEQVPYVQSSAKNPSNCNRTLSSPDLSNTNQGTTGKIRTKYSFKRGYSLNKEWDPPTLSLPPQNNHNLTNGSLEMKCEPKPESTALPSTALTSTATQVDLVSSFPDKRDKGKSFPFNWPGLDAIIEAYYKHNNDQLLEKELLRKKCSQLKTKQDELKTEASNISKSMSDFLKLKRELDQQRSQSEKAIESIKQFIQAGR